MHDRYAFPACHENDVTSLNFYVNRDRNLSLSGFRMTYSGVADDARKLRGEFVAGREFREFRRP
jgi:hypothetical protein